MNLFYFPLEPVKSRYTFQLSNLWMPHSFKQFDWNIITIEGKELKEKDIKVGHVLDSIGRSIYSFSQITNFLENFLDKGLVKNNDVIFFQDFWTPGIEAIYYALDLHKIKVRTYSMLHAQSVDEYDFTYDMKEWMRPFELGIDNIHKTGGIFVGSTIHREQLRQANFKSPIHVLSLPLDKYEVICNKHSVKKKKQIVYSSRMNTEKNPLFMIETAERFLELNKDYVWICTTSSPKFRSDSDLILTELYKFASMNDRFILKENLSKEEYYIILNESEIQFNSALQDYVSWTMLEAVSFGCKLVYPNFRSFSECVLDKEYLYNSFNVEDSLSTLQKVTNMNLSNFQNKVLDISNLGRLFESYIMYNDVKKEFNVWTDYETMKKMIL